MFFRRSTPFLPPLASKVSRPNIYFKLASKWKTNLGETATNLIDLRLGRCRDYLHVMLGVHLRETHESNSQYLLLTVCPLESILTLRKLAIELPESFLSQFSLEPCPLANCVLTVASKLCFPAVLCLLHINMDVKKIALAIVLYKIKKRNKEKEKIKRSCWVKPWIKRRSELGACFTLTKELQLEDAQQFRNFIRMNAVEVQYIIELVGPMIAKSNTKMREAISVYERVMVTLRFLATGNYMLNIV